MDSTEFNWNDLRYFLAVARSRTISLAGRRLGVDHATVARRLAALEEALGLQLFERTPRGYNLTRHGETLLGMAKGLEVEAVRIQENASGKNQGLSGSVRISTPEGFGNYFLAARMGPLVEAHPKMTVEVITIQQIVALSRREADVVVTLTEPPAGNYVHEHLTDYSLHVYASKSYLAGSPPIRARDDLLDHRFIGYVDDLIFTRALNYLPEIHPGLRAGLQNSSLSAQVSATVAGMGLCVLPTYIARHEPDLVPVLPDQISLRRSYWMVADLDLANTAQVRLARRFIRTLMTEKADFFTPKLHA